MIRYREVRDGVGGLYPDTQGQYVDVKELFKVALAAGELCVLLKEAIPHLPLEFAQRVHAALPKPVPKEIE